MAATHDPVSPELVLIDPRLATSARAVLAEPGDTLAQLGHQVPLKRASPSARNSADKEVGAALRRITELSEVEPPKKQRRRLVSLAAVTAAWGAVVVLAAELELGLYEWPF